MKNIYRALTRFFYVSCFISIVLYGSGQAKNATGLGPAVSLYLYENNGRGGNYQGFGGLVQIEKKLGKILSVNIITGVELPYVYHGGAALRLYAVSYFYIQAGGFFGIGPEGIGHGGNVGLGVAVPLTKTQFLDLSFRLEEFLPGKDYFKIKGLRLTYNFASKQKSNLSLTTNILSSFIYNSDH